ncbi:MAG TPA: PD-(D/E)XK nuclease family protein [Cellvibrionaceae bacterium]
MARALFSIEHLLPAITRRRLILTANNRQRNQILNAWAAYEQHHSDTPSIRIVTQSQWQQFLWQQLLTVDTESCRWRAMDGWQQQYLWQQAIEASPYSLGLLQAKPMAATAEMARAALGAWRLPAEDLAGYSTDDDTDKTTAFLDWLMRFRQLQDRHQLLSADQIAERLLSAFASGLLAPESGAVLYGFDDVPPLTQLLLNTGLPEHAVLPVKAQVQPLLLRTRAEDADSEVRAAALWASAILADDPEASIGIIVPELGQERERISRIFAAVFEPLLSLPEQPRYAAALNFSAGTPLARTPVVHCALEWLALLLMPFTTDRLCNLLTGSFTCADHLPAQTTLASHLRDLAYRRISIQVLVRKVEQLVAREVIPADAGTGLVDALDLVRKRHHTHSLGDWLTMVFDWLARLGWPGTRALDSVEYQQLKKWYELLDELGSIDQLDTELTLADVYSLLCQSAERTHFQPQTPQSPIQVLGALEGAGLTFSHCWVLGMHHRQWPPAAVPNPLLPVSIQRQHGLPHASAERELDYARRLTQSYRQAASTVVFSHAAFNQDEPLRASALIADVAYQPLETLVSGISAEEHFYQQVRASGRFESVHCDYGPPLENPAVKGGAGVFKQQAACPFNAFARYRLGAYAPALPTLGFSAIERGNMLHDALASLWLELQNQQKLLALDEAQRNALIASACETAVAKVRKRRPTELLTRYCQIEQQRLAEQIERWLVHECERPAFTVLAIEQALECDFAGLSLKLRVDRIDQLASGRQMIIDYKTGNASPKSWRIEQFQEPQLPLYASIYRDKAAAIAFGIVNVHQQQLSGWGDSDGEMPGISAPPDGDWTSQQQAWQQQLTALADEFKAGYAAVNYRYRQAADYDTELLPLARTADSLQENLQQQEMESEH